ncbi:metallo-beta-lactamase superfamily protein [Neorickettsia helminthoeca str. Oregon]|uniref:Metallo-beta-lactamase superfamily protein n=1 Tax=Neorickettsia helminthoeca str. Oregon TaxID=1286528 RepID=X5HM53_9RICK|nr:MBL fold metallo-hydrolase [Neorickettsia helminthoeca]AHX11500.1 metallo-beta-lactamase superfamily protein [Neorickettsia helminthoeca str. Oregon]
MRIRILGCGNSVGVPLLGCSCRVCLSSNPKDVRTRCSVLVESCSSRLLIDTSPDLRLQAIRENFSSVDQVFYTHIHFDHTAGIHELSSFTPIDERRSIRVLGDEFTISHIQQVYSYLFRQSHIGGAPWKRCYLEARIVPYYEEFFAGDISCMIFPQTHGNINSCGIILDRKFVYCTDVRLIPEKALEIMRSCSLEVFIIECFDYEKAHAHSNLDEALEYIEIVAPKRAFLTHMTHKLGYEDLIANLSARGVSHVMPAYDGLSFEV